MDMNSFATLNATAIVNGTMRVWWVPNYPNVPFQFNVTNLVLPGGSTMTLHNYYRWQIFCNAACEAKQKRDANVDPATPGYNGSNHASMTGLLGNLDLTNEPGFGGNLEAYPEAISVWGGPAVSISGQFTVSPFGIGVSVQFATTFTPALRTSAPLEPFVWKCMPYAGPTVIRPR